MTDVKQDLVKAIDVVAQSWMTGDFAALAGVLHRDVIFRAPGGNQAIEGREACLNSYVAFKDAAEIQNFSTGDAVIDYMEDVAMVLQPWSILYSMAGQAHDENGQDVYLFRRSEGRWQLYWRGAAASE